MGKIRFRRSPIQPSSQGDILGLTLLDLLKHTNQPGVNPLKIFQGTPSGWDYYPQAELVRQVELTAAGLIDLGLKQGDRVGFLLKSDTSFLVMDMACVQANVVSVPLDLSQTIENIISTLDHSQARVLIVVNLGILKQVLPYLRQAQSLKWVVLLDDAEAQSISHCCRPMPNLSESCQVAVPSIPASVGLELRVPLMPPDASVFPGAPYIFLSWQNLQTRGQRTLNKCPQLFQDLDASRSAQDLATLIYIPHEDGSLKGVMLSHENLTSTALAAFSGIKGLRWGQRESVVTFLPLTHIFARVMLYGHLYYSHTIYFSSPKWVMKHLREVRPTILSTVPILIHRLFHKLQAYGEKPIPISPSKYFHRWCQWPKQSLNVVKQRGHRWAMAIAQQRSVEQPYPRVSFRTALEYRFASLIFHQWKRMLGGRIRYCLTGGAALDAKIASFFLNIGLPLYQGYGLTQTSSVVTFNHPDHNLPGTVGQVRLGAECIIATDGEVLVKGTGVMQGYFKDPELSALVINEQGWFHTGDLGYLDEKGTLTLVGRKKSLFKLTTGKYVTPKPLEATLERSPLVHRAFVVGDERKYCAAILFVKPQTLLHEAKKLKLTHYPVDLLLENPCIVALYDALVHQANCYFPYWSTIKRIQLLQASAYPKSLESETSANLRAALARQFTTVIDDLYQAASSRQSIAAPLVSKGCQTIPLVSCPVAGQSLNTKLS